MRMTCREITDFLDDYLARDLDPDVRAVFERHLVGCRPCVAYLRSYRDTVRLAKEACGDPDDCVPADVPPELLVAIRAAARGVDC